MKTVKSVLFRKTPGIEQFHDNLIELRKILHMYAEQKLEMLENSKKEIEELVKLGNQMDQEKLDSIAKKLMEENENQKSKIREKIKEIPEEYL